MKTNKSFTKRLRVTRRGKILGRKPGQNHFNAKQSGSARLAKRRAIILALPKRVTRRFLPNAGA